MPLIEGTEYDDLLDLTRGSAIAAGDGDPHQGTVAHYVMALNPASRPLRQTASFTMMMGAQVQGDPLGWLGSSLAIYAEDSPFWDELQRNAEDLDTFMEDNFQRIPLAAHVAVKNSLALTAFLTALRSFVETSAPGTTLWEVCKHGEMSYVKVSAAEPGGTQAGSEGFALFYAATPDSLVVTLNEDLLKRALDRRASRRDAAPEGSDVPGGTEPWLGESACFQAERAVLELVEAFAGERYHEVMQRRSWGNIPILNEWKRLYAERDPLEVHQRVWETRLVCPGGGTYVWNREWRTMESTAYGHPAQPKEGPGWPEPVRRVLSANLGLTLRERSLRARAVIGRQAEGH
jgi:hypothetical protein